MNDYAMGEKIYDLAKHGKVLTLQTYDKQLTVKVKVIHDLGVTALLVARHDQPLPPKGKARIMPVFEIENYFAQFEIVNEK